MYENKLIFDDRAIVHRVDRLRRRFRPSIRFRNISRLLVRVRNIGRLLVLVGREMDTDSVRILSHWMRKV